MCIEFPKPPKKTKETKPLARSNIRTKHKSKPKNKKMTEQQKRNKKAEIERVPLNGYECFFCGSTENIELHEIEWGKNRTTSIANKMVIAADIGCHRMDKYCIHDETGKHQEMYNMTVIYGRNKLKEINVAKDWDEIFR